MNRSTPGLPVHHQLLELTQTHVHWVSDAVQPSHPLSSPSPPAFLFPSLRVFSSESVLRIRWPEYWSFSFSISPSDKYSGLVWFRLDWLDLLSVQGTLRSLLQYHSSEASILGHSAFFHSSVVFPFVDIWQSVYELSYWRISGVFPVWDCYKCLYPFFINLRYFFW